MSLDWGLPQVMWEWEVLSPLQPERRATRAGGCWSGAAPSLQLVAG